MVLVASDSTCRRWWRARSHTPPPDALVEPDVPGEGVVPASCWTQPRGLRRRRRTRWRRGSDTRRSWEGAEGEGGNELGQTVGNVAGGGGSPPSSCARRSRILKTRVGVGAPGRRRGTLGQSLEHLPGFRRAHAKLLKRLGRVRAGVGEQGKMALPPGCLKSVTSYCPPTRTIASRRSARAYEARACEPGGFRLGFGALRGAPGQGRSRQGVQGGHCLFNDPSRFKCRRPPAAGFFARGPSAVGGGSRGGGGSNTP